MVSLAPCLSVTGRRPLSARGRLFAAVSTCDGRRSCPLIWSFLSTLSPMILAAAPLSGIAVMTCGRPWPASTCTCTCGRSQMSSDCTAATACMRPTVLSLPALLPGVPLLHTVAKWLVLPHLLHVLPWAGHSCREWRCFLPQPGHGFSVSPFMLVVTWFLLRCAFCSRSFDLPFLYEVVLMSVGLSFPAAEILVPCLVAFSWARQICLVLSRFGAGSSSSNFCLVALSLTPTRISVASHVFASMSARSASSAASLSAA